MTNYISKINNIPIGGNIINGQWVAKILTLYSGVPNATSAANSPSYINYSLTDYLPDDNYIYEIIIRAYCYSGVKVNQNLQIKIYSNNNTSALIFLTACRSKVNGINESAGAGLIPVMTNRALGIRFDYDKTGTATLNTKIEIMGYRRVGTNNLSDKHIKNISCENIKYVIGGQNYDGQFVNKAATIFSGNWSTGSGNVYSQIFDLKAKGLLPADKYQYEIMIHCWCKTHATAGYYAQITLASSIIGGTSVCAAKTMTNNGNDNWRSATIPIGSDGKLRMTIYASANSSSSAQLFLVGYRRLGTNT